MPHSRGGPHRLGGRAAPLRCRDAQASPRRIAEAAVLVPALGPGLCLQRPAPGIRHSAFGTRPPALTFDSAIRPPTLPPAPDARSVDAAPISERWKIQLFRRSFLYPSPCPRQLHPCSASVHRLPRPPVLSALFCASLPSGTSPPPLSVQHDALCVPPPAASLSLSHVAAPFFPPRVATSCRRRFAPPCRRRFAPPRGCLRTLSFLSSSGHPLFPGRTLPDTSSLERGAGCSVRGLPIKQKSPKSALWSSFIARSG